MLNDVTYLGPVSYLFKKQPSEYHAQSMSCPILVITPLKSVSVSKWSGSNMLFCENFKDVFTSSISVQELKH